MTATLPLHVEDLTAPWLGGVLGVPIEEMEVTDIIWGTATKVFVRIGASGSDNDVPEHLCIKGGFQDELRAFGVAQSYVVEATFYNEVAPGLAQLEIPRTFFAGVEPEAEQGVIVFEDLRSRNCVFGDPVSAMTPDQAARTLELMAAWHAASTAGGLDLSGLASGSPAVRATADVLFTDAHFDQQTAIEGMPGIPEDLYDPARIKRAFQALWAVDDAGAQWLSHGDAHIGNTYTVVEDGTAGILDWQVACLAPPMYDVAYFIGGALDIEDRRGREQDLLKHYLGALAAAGGPGLDFDDAWLDYRRHAMHGFFWAVTPPAMQTVERVAAMSRRHVAMVEDLETLAALEGR
jgi:hypothetical protein